ncbi:MAG: DNA-processing protein DprA, partial [Caulobacteraceae bacterium]
MSDARRATRELSDRERIDWLRLARTPSIGPMTFRHLMGRYESPARAIAALPDLGRRGGRSQGVEMPTAADMAAELRAGEALGARLITSVEPGYPRLLAVLDPPPPLLWVLGDVGQLSRPAVAVVGARVASAAGQRFARDLAAALGEAGYAVISGMARGIDAAAHEGAMSSGTAAVLAGGIDDIYPPEHHELYERLRARGCLVSEQPIGYRAKAKDFPRRNRIISGLALGVVVVEAELRSGSLITARLAGEQGRDVFAVPGSPMDPRSRGANDLIRQGATLVEEVEDVLRVLTTASAIAEPVPPSWPVEEAD